MAEIESPDTITLFYCYAQEDKRLRGELEKHLADLRRNSLIDDWSDLKIPPGVERDPLIEVHLKTADIILLLISSDFMDSDYCQNILMKQALERHFSGETCVVLVLLRPVDINWEHVSLSRLPRLPSTDKPVSTWSNHDAAFENIVEGIRKILKDAWLKKGDAFYKAERYNSALVAFEKALLQDGNFGPAYIRRGCVLHDLGFHQEAIASFEAAIYHDPMDAYAYYFLGTLLYDCEDYNRALSSFEKAIQLNHLLVSAHVYLGLVLEKQGEPQTAILIYERYLELHPYDIIVDYFKRDLINRSTAKEFHREVRHMAEQFLRGMDDYYRSSSYRFPNTNEEPIPFFINTLHWFSAGLQGFQRAAQALADNYSSWLKDFCNSLQATYTQQHEAFTEAFDAIENPEIKELLSALLTEEARNLDNQTNAIDRMCDYLQSLKVRGVDTIDRVIEEWERALRELSRQLEERQQQSWQLLDALHRTDVEGLFSE